MPPSSAPLDDHWMTKVFAWFGSATCGFRQWVITALRLRLVRFWLGYIIHKIYLRFAPAQSFDRSLSTFALTAECSFDPDTHLDSWRSSGLRLAKLMNTFNYNIRLMHYVRGESEDFKFFKLQMRDNMIICISGRGPGHCMAVDLNIEHLIGYLKNLLQAKGMNSMWDRLGNISAAIVHIQSIKKKMASALGTAHQGTGHTTPDTSHLVWRVQHKVANEGLHAFDAEDLRGQTQVFDTRHFQQKNDGNGGRTRIRG
ncbi:hypothetical protein B0H13DRAFT_1856308 [Mycena leptocephala]|nr:hypothetical protein B0H13DRAFT_1856308 [Mycena leptocephala]